MKPDIEELIKIIEDQMVKNLALDTTETRLYYHLLRHSRLIGKHEALVSVEQLSVFGVTHLSVLSGGAGTEGKGDGE